MPGGSCPCRDRSVVSRPTPKAFAASQKREGNAGENNDDGDGVAGGLESSPGGIEGGGGVAGGFESSSGGIYELLHFLPLG